MAVHLLALPGLMPTLEAKQLQLFKLTQSVGGAPGKLIACRLYVGDIIFKNELSLGLGA